MTIWLASTPADYLSTAEARNSPRLFHRIECLPALLFFASAGHGPALPIFASAGHGPALPIFAFAGHGPAQPIFASAGNDPASPMRRVR